MNAEQHAGGGTSEGDKTEMTRGRRGLIAYLILSLPPYYPPLIWCSR